MKNKIIEFIIFNDKSTSDDITFLCYDKISKLLNLNMYGTIGRF